MKTLFRTMVMVLFVLPAVAQSDFKTLKLTPSQPEPATQLSLTYDPKGTKLANASTVEATAFVSNEEDEPTAISIPMRKDGNVWQGTFTVPANALALAFNFTNGDQLHDTNNEKGYDTYLYKNATILPGSRAALGKWFNGSVYYADLDPDRDRAKALYQEEFKVNPSRKRQLVTDYIWTLSRRVPADKVIMEAEAVELAKNTDLSLKELAALSSAYDAVGKKEEAGKYQQLLKTKFPNSGDALYMAYRRFGQEKDVAKKKSMLDSIQTRFAKEPNLRSFEGYMLSDMAKAYIVAGKPEEASKLATTPARAASVMQAYNSIAWSNAEKDSNLVQSAQLSKQATEWAKEQIGKPRTSSDSKALTDSKLNNQRKGTYAMYADTYGFILMKQGKMAEAASYLKDAVANNKYSNPEINHRYAQALANTGATSELISFGKKVISEGNSNEKLEELFKTAFTKEKGAAGYDAELAASKKDAAAKMKAELMDKMISKAAPEFSLMDLNGKPVSLASLKGKVVVVDFWATWCGPCVASFPGMQKAVAKYAQSPDVAFLFINTWQGEADKKKNAADFIEKKKYTFQVLLDETDDVVTNYKVSGIPTKYIIDKNGSIRFKSIGYNGDSDKTANEIGQMVDILREMPTQAVTAVKTGE